MHPVVKWAGAIAAALLGCTAFAGLYVYVASEAIVERRYPLPAIEEPAVPSPKLVQRGAHLAAIAGCSDCHGTDFQGRRASKVEALQVWSSNLRLAATKMSDGEFERALRRGIAPDATSLWGMPSADDTYMSESDVAGLRAYLRSLGAAGQPRPQAVWTYRARLALLDGRITPAVLVARDAPSSLDLGPRYDGGRYLARVACSECHGTDLDGLPARGAPDLDTVLFYSRPAFFDLLRRGAATRWRGAPVMKRLASARFYALADYEIVALYDYLDARAHAPPALVARAKANEARRRAEIAFDSDN